MASHSAVHSTNTSGTTTAITAEQNAFTITDGADGKIRITATTAAELTGGLGVYLREFCGMTVGWASRAIFICKQRRECEPLCEPLCEP